MSDISGGKVVDLSIVVGRETNSTSRLLRLQDVLAITSLASLTLYHLMGEGRFPRPLRLGKRVVLWEVDQVEKWLESLPRSEGGKATNRALETKQ